MKKFVWNKVLGAMDKRQSKIDQQFKDADEDRRAAGALKTEYEGRLAGADEESARLIADAKVTAKAKADKIVDQAKLTSDKMVRDAHQTIEHERNEALQSVKHDIAALAMDAAAKVVSKEASELDNSAIYDDFLAGLIAGILGRYFFSFLSGWIFFAVYTPDFFNSAILYSLAYNGAYIGLEAAITLIVLALPPVNEAMQAVKKLVCEA